MLCLAVDERALDGLMQGLARVFEIVRVAEGVREELV